MYWLLVNTASGTGMDEGMQTEEKAMKKCRGQESMA
jgi:hypothetical protein